MPAGMSCAMRARWFRLRGARCCSLLRVRSAKRGRLVPEARVAYAHGQMNEQQRLLADLHAQIDELSARRREVVNSCAQTIRHVA